MYTILCEMKFGVVEIHFPDVVLNKKKQMVYSAFIERGDAQESCIAHSKV